VVECFSIQAFFAVVWTRNVISPTWRFFTPVTLFFFLYVEDIRDKIMNDEISWWIVSEMLINF